MKIPRPQADGSARQVRANVARVALGATLLSLVVYLLACFVVDFVVVHRLDSSIDSRLATRLSQVVPTLPPGGPKEPIGSYSPQFSGDFDDAPIVLWWVPPNAHVSAATGHQCAGPARRRLGRGSTGRCHRRGPRFPPGRHGVERRPPHSRDHGPTGTHRPIDPAGRRGGARASGPCHPVRGSLGHRPESGGASRTGLAAPARVHGRRFPRTAHPSQRHRGRSRPGIERQAVGSRLPRRPRRVVSFAVGIPQF